MRISIIQLIAAALLTASVAASSAPMALAVEGDGVIREKSAYSIRETIARVKKDIGAKGIRFFDQIDQSKLAAGAKIRLRPSTLLIFGNPPLGIQFLTSNPAAGLDWPVRLLVTEDENRDVWMLYTDFAWIAERHGIKDRDAAFNMATQVIASIVSSAKVK